MEDRPIIFIVDDEPSARKTLIALLKNEGYHIDIAENGHAALSYLEKHTPDVILLDVMMPDMDGYEVCHKVKNHDDWKHIPIILVTALDSKEDLVRGLDLGADDFLNKPVRGMELRARVRSMLRIKQQYDELQAVLTLREDLADMIVHDLRNPLTVILLCADVINQYGNLSGQMKNTSLRLIKKADELNSMIDDLLLLAKVKTGTLILSKKPTQLYGFFKEIILPHRELCEARGINLEISENLSETDKIEIDTKLLGRVLDNLLSNAIKYSDSGNTIGLNIQYLKDEDTPLKIDVIDQGPGIPEAEHEGIFNKFEVASSRKAGVAQTGIGLFFCKMVVEAHTGHIAVNNNKPTGSIFTIKM